MVKVVLAQNLLQANEAAARKNREQLEQQKVLTINLISSPGAGKTSLLEATINQLKNDFLMGVVEGDIYTSRDAERIAQKKVQVVQVNTGGICHLNAEVTGRAFRELDLSKLDLLFIENIGNLVCPAEFDLGEDIKVALLSTAEGSDKVFKYPLVFKEAEAVVITKCDLLAHVDFDLKETSGELKKVNPHLKLFVLSSKTGEGLEEWCAWLQKMLQAKKTGKLPAATT